MHAENGGVIDVLVQRALAERADGAEVPRADASGPGGSRGDAPRDRARRRSPDVPVYIVHLSAAEALEMVTEARDRGLPAYAETCPQYLFLSYDELRGARIRGREVRHEPSAAAAEATQERLWRGLAGNDLQAISTDHCPFCMKGQKELGAGRLLEDPERRARHRDAHEPGLRRRRADRAGSR